MNASTEHDSRRGAEAGFTLVEALVAIVVLVFGLMAVTNLLLVAASSNTVANQGTAAVTAATSAMDFLRVTSFDALAAAAPGGTPFDANDGGLDCDAPALVLTDFHCSSTLPGVGTVHTHWYVTAMADPRLLFLRVQSEGTGALAAARSRAEFTTFRSCTNDDPTTGLCPVAP